MKRPCPMCKKIVDDGLPCPPNADPELMKKSHKVCKHCLPDFNRYATEQMKSITAMKLMKGGGDMSEKTAIEKMVEWFGDKFSNTINCQYEQGEYDALRRCQLRAQELALEEREQLEADKKHAEELEASMTAAIKEKMEEQKPSAPASLVDEVISELQRATLKFGPFNSAHEGYAVLKEEVDELWDEIKKKAPDKSKLEEESKQIAAMGIRFAMDICGRTLSRHPAPAKSALVEEGYHSGKVNAKSCNCVGPDKCTDKSCELVRRHEGKEGGV